MVNVLVRDVPADVHAHLMAQAAASGQSLQQYLKAELLRLSTRSRPTMTLAEATERMRTARESHAAQSGRPVASITGQEIADIIRQERGERPDDVGGDYGA